MHIRSFQQGDEPALWEVFFSAIHQTASAQYTPEQINAWAPPAADPVAWAERMRGIRPFVVEAQGAIIAYADLQESGYIDHFFVAPAVGRQGVGSALMRHIHEQARSRGIAALSSDVSLTARPFFERWGFQIERAQTVVVRGIALQNFHMSKALSPNPENEPAKEIQGGA
jgi:putative acetyltransferase